MWARFAEYAPGEMMGPVLWAGSDVIDRSRQKDLHSFDVANLPVRDDLSGTTEGWIKRSECDAYFFLCLSRTTNDGVAFLCIHRHRLFDQNMESRFEGLPAPGLHACEGACRCPRYAIVLLRACFLDPHKRAAHQIGERPVVLGWHLRRTPRRREPCPQFFSRQVGVYAER